MRAKYPDSDGFVERGGVNTHYEVYGEGEHTVFLMPTWSLYHSRAWKAQIPYLSRHQEHGASRPAENRGIDPPCGRTGGG